jgi:hypothetical protein
MNAKTINCKESGCDKTVVYEPDEIPGTVRMETMEYVADQIEVYLTCEDGHTHKYKV